ncbi:MULTISPECIES: class A beta-lactamase, subclass A2 [Cyanophyceae]|uniref:class A beta-lactamase, subclass A2 n=1 Tax=Cyanophyceae TaxID=3028117 RepID=UPI0016840FD0|nr:MULTISPECIES: class A beta-lactamase, subclass A2 [Cyanophyceae]MBD1917968.1 class A beta-lactamase, subclass A2 [Phormidium sp. FACHB-77]MBD2029216.1 class A beta-lactamase, subclass A2 [Phormidium sp. FACHB-322]MBD2049748.1 class A beta-lactamase, subclass A2 [Leptolyngbya sp. FACHB-60]
MIRATIKSVWLCVFCFSLLTTGCTSNNSSNRADNQNSQTDPLEEVVASNANNELRNQIGQISQAAQGRVGVTVTVLETGESVTLNGDQQFPMQSVYKFPIAMAVLAQIDQGKLRLEQQVRVEASDFVSDLQHSPIRDENPQGVELSLAELLKYMVSESDGTACDVLLKLVGGPEVVTQHLRNLGVNGIVVANTEKEIGQDKAVQYRNYATPDGAVALLRTLHEGLGLSESSQALLLQLMTETPTGLQRIKGLLPDGTVVAHKTGTSRTVDGVTAATNDVGLVTLPNGQHLAIAVFVSDSTANDTIREEVIAKVARAAWDEWSK